MANIEFYKSKAWRDVKRNVWIEQACLCAYCGKPVYVAGLSQWLPKEKRLKGIVHHKTYLNDVNVYDDAIALDSSNLVGVCIDCHNQEHKSQSTRQGYRFDERGNLVKA